MDRGTGNLHKIYINGKSFESIKSIQNLEYRSRAANSWKYRNILPYLKMSNLTFTMKYFGMTAVSFVIQIAC